MYVPFPFPWLPPLSAPADNGTTSVRAASADSAKRRPPRPPDPQSAFLRDSPREPLPHRAFARTPRFQSVRSRIVGRAPSSALCAGRSSAGEACCLRPNVGRGGRLCLPQPRERALHPPFGGGGLL